MILKPSLKRLAFDNRTKSRGDLAEIIGILLGDGGIHLDTTGKYQVHIACNKAEVQYLSYLQKLFGSYFQPYSFYITELQTEYLLRNISVQLANHLFDSGLKSGDKILSKAVIPLWIFSDSMLLQRCIRGLFDTDGCVYRKFGKYAQLQFKFGGLPLIISLRNALLQVGFSPTRIQQECNDKFIHWKLYIIRQQEIERFFKLIEPKNSKHCQRYKNIKLGTRGFEPRTNGLEPFVITKFHHVPDRQ